MLRNLALVVCAALGCSSSEEAEPQGSAPIAGTLPPASSPFATFGSITIASNGGLERIVDASFARTNASKCTFEIVAGCVVSTCPNVIETVVPVDPGKITVSSPSIGENVELPLMMGRGRIVQGGAFAPTESIRVTAPGGEAPAFDLTVAMPPEPSEWSFAGCLAATSCTVDGSKPLAKWSGAAAEVVTVGISVEKDRENTWNAACSYSGSSGAGRIPGEVFARMPRARSGRASFSNGVSVRAESGSHLTTVRAAALPIGFSISFITR